MQCEKCHSNLSKKEIEAYDTDELITRVICDECHEMEENSEFNIDEFSDADPGL